MKIRTNLNVFVVMSVVLLAITSATADIITVDPNGTGEYPTIQAAIDASYYDGDTVIVAPGTYTGLGNRDIDFLGKAITVRSTETNDPNIVAATIIDCNGTEAEPHRGFYFHSGEDANSVLSGITITNGYSEKGSGIYCISGSPMIANCSFYQNGAFFTLAESELTTTESSGETRPPRRPPSPRGGGMYNDQNSSPIVVNCTFISNGWEGAGGGMFNYISSPMVTNCTFSENRARYGGGMCNWFGSNPTVTNCILWDNTAPNGPQVYNYDSSPAISYSDIQGGWLGQGNIDSDPCFVNPDIGDYHLLPDSPCIDAGDSCYVPAPGETDLDGNPRIVNGIVDMGAFEAQLRDPVELLVDLAQDVIELNLQQGISNSLDSKLQAAMQALDDINENNNVAAINTLEAFINAVNAQRGNKISEADADALIASSQEIIELLSIE